MEMVCDATIYSKGILFLDDALEKNKLILQIDIKQRLEKNTL